MTTPSPKPSFRRLSIRCWSCGSLTLYSSGHLSSSLSTLDGLRPRANRAVRVDRTCLAALPPLSLDTVSWSCSAWVSVNPISRKMRRDSSVSGFLDGELSSWWRLVEEHNNLHPVHRGWRWHLQNWGGLTTEEAFLIVHRRSCGKEKRGYKHAEQLFARAGHWSLIWLQRKMITC